MIWGNSDDLRKAVVRLRHFVPMFKADGPFTALTPFGRNLALFFDCADKPDEGSKARYLSDLVLCAGAGSILFQKCDAHRILDRPDIQAEIASWWWRANEFVNLPILYGLKK